MDESQRKEHEWREFPIIETTKNKTPIIDEDLMELYNYFKNKRSCIWDEIGYTNPHSLSDELFQLDKYIQYIENINKKLLLS